MRVGIVIGEAKTTAAIVFGDEKVQPIFDALNGYSECYPSDVMFRPDRRFSDGALVGHPAADLAADQAAAATVPHKLVSVGRELALGRNRSLVDLGEAEWLLSATAILLEKCGRDIDAVGGTRSGIIMVGPPVDHDITTAVIGPALSLANFSAASVIARDEAAAWAFWLNTKRRDEKRLLVVDLGEVGVRLSRMRLKLSVVDGAEPVFKLEVEDRGHSQRSSWPNPWKPEELATTLRTLIAEVLSDRDIPLDVVLIGPLASDHALSGTVKDQVRNVQTPEKVASFHHWDEAVLAQAVVKEEPPPAARSFALSVANPGEMRALKQMPINAGSYDLADERKEFGAPDRTGPAPTSVLIPVFGAPPDLSRLGNNTKDYARQLADAWATDVHKICLRRPTAPTVDLVQTYATRYRQLGFVDVPAESALPSPATLSSAAQRYCDAVIAELKADGSDRDEQSYADLATHFPDLASEALLKGPPHQNLSGDLVVWTNKSDRADPGPLGLAWPGEIVLSERAAPNVSAFDKIKIPRPGYAASMLPPSMATITAAVPRSGIGNWVRWLGGGTKSVPFIGGAMAAMIAATLLFLEQSFDLKDRFVPPQTYLGPFDVSEPSTATVSCTPEVAPAENVTAAAAFCTSKLSFNSGPDLRPVPSPSQIGDDPRAACALIHYRIVRATVVREGENSIPVTYAGSGRTGESNVWRERCDKLLDTEILRQFAYTPIDGSPPLTLVGPPTAAFPLTAEGEELAADGKVVRSNRIFWHENITEAGLSILDVFWAEPIEGVGGKPAIGGWDQTVTLQDEEPTTPLTSLIGKCWVYGISGQVLISPDYEDRAVSLTPETVERAIFDAVQTPVAAPDRLLKLSFDGPDGTGAYSWVIGPLTDPPSPESETDLQKPCYP